MEFMKILIIIQLFSATVAIYFFALIHFEIVEINEILNDIDKIHEKRNENIKKIFEIY